MPSNKCSGLGREGDGDSEGVQQRRGPPALSAGTGLPGPTAPGSNPAGCPAALRRGCSWINYLQLQLSLRGCGGGREGRRKVAKQDFCLSVLFLWWWLGFFVGFFRVFFWWFFVCLFLCFPFPLLDKTGQGVFVGDRQGREVFQK